jgi:hypothetical protein
LWLDDGRGSIGHARTGYGGWLSLPVAASVRRVNADVNGFRPVSFADNDVLHLVAR